MNHSPGGEARGSEGGEYGRQLLTEHGGSMGSCGRSAWRSISSLAPKAVQWRSCRESALLRAPLVVAACSGEVVVFGLRLLVDPKRTNASFLNLGAPDDGDGALVLQQN